MERHIEEKISENEQNITPWVATSKSGFDYLKLIEKFGCSPIDSSLIERFEKITKKPIHPWLRRGIFFSHKDLDLILTDVENNKPVYLYTGRGPTSESMHLGHMIPFMLTAYLQNALNCICIIQMSDDEKYFFKGGSLAEYLRLTYANAKDIIACGFDLEKTFICSNTLSMGGDLYKVNIELMRNTTGNQIKGIYGLDLNDNVGMIAWPCMQAAPAFNHSFPHVLGKEPIRCLVAMAIDQAPYFRMARDLAEKLKYLKPAEIHTKFLIGLGGINDKMSSTGQQNSVIFLSDTKKQIEDKIKKFAFSGGGNTLEEHREKGGNLEIDVSYQYLLHFENDDEILKTIAQDYSSGKMTTGEIKKIAIAAVWKFVERHQTEKAKINDELLMKYFDTSIVRELKSNLNLRNGDFEFSKIDKNFGFNFDPFFGCLKN